MVLLIVLGALALTVAVNPAQLVHRTPTPGPLERRTGGVIFVVALSVVVGALVGLQLGSLLIGLLAAAAVSLGVAIALPEVD